MSRFAVTESKSASQLLLATVAMLGLSASVALAGMPDEVLVLTAQNDNGAGHMTIRVKDCAWDPSLLKLTWTSASPVTIHDDDTGETVATLKSATLTVRRFVRINLVAEVEAGGSETTFTFRAAHLSFPTVSSADAQGQASMSATVKDLNNDGFYLRATGDAVFYADFAGQAPNGSHFTQLLGAIEGGAGGTGNAFQKDPISGYRVFGESVGDISCYAAFVLSASDRATISGAYRLIPEPTCTDDADGDLVPDCVDDCPSDGGKFEPGSCGCGVADIDSDGDGVLDCLDTCPDGGEPGPCGCGEVVDSDGDGTPDCVDECPNDPNKTKPGACGCGVADTDSDGDGVADCNDQAPEDVQVGGDNGEDSADDPVEPAPDDAASDDANGDDSVVAGEQASAGDNADSNSGSDAGGNAGGNDAGANGNQTNSFTLNVPSCGFGALMPLALTVVSLIGLRSGRRGRRF